MPINCTLYKKSILAPPVFPLASPIFHFLTSESSTFLLRCYMLFVTIIQSSLHYLWIYFECGKPISSNLHIVTTRVIRLRTKKSFPLNSMTQSIDLDKRRLFPARKLNAFYCLPLQHLFSSTQEFSSGLWWFCSIILCLDHTYIPQKGKYILYCFLKGIQVFDHTTIS